MSKYAQGKFKPTNTDKYLGRQLPTYRSSWEQRFMMFCDTNPSVISWASEPVKIPYFNPVKNKQTIYVPDFLIEYIDKNRSNHKELIEIKPRNQTLFEKTRSQRNKIAWVINQAKWQAAEVWCKQYGIAFRILGENELFHTGSSK